MKKSIFLLLTVCLLIGMAMSIPLSANGGSDYIVSDEGRLPFEDVKTEYWYYKSAEFCYANGIIKGMNEYTFAPIGTLTR
ncbi:MAG: S-layer homology domain-containing protein, partial [Clostridia bacterium]|nr:S-layer homology domain-containing protein [Clostridia bacterium]